MNMFGLLLLVVMPAAEPSREAELLKTFRQEFVAVSPGRDNFPAALSLGESARHRKTIRFALPDPSSESGSATKPLFSMAKYEVTQELWESVMGSNPSRWKGPRNSVEMITYEDAQEFCRKLTVKLRAAALIAADEIVALPSEAQWEYCARAGTTTKYSFGDDATQLGDYAWYTGNAAGNDPPVGAKKPNAWGLYDMHGYLWEICADDWAEDVSKVPDDGRPYRRVPPSNPAEHVIRGGSWKDKAEALTSGSRRKLAHSETDDAVGFRCVLLSAP